MVETNLRRIQNEIAEIAGSRNVKLIGASKTVDAGRVRDAFNAGLRCFGENRIQEGIPKIQELPKEIEWHFIGHLQSNKARDAVRYFSWIHSIDSARLLTIVDKEAQKQQKRISALVEINLGGEETKNGARPDELQQIMDVSRSSENVNLCGLMCIPPFSDDPQQVRPYFKKLRELASRFPQLKELSMGMSQDYAVAIEEGATMVRIGTALFGARPVRK